MIRRAATRLRRFAAARRRWLPALVAVPLAPVLGLVAFGYWHSDLVSPPPSKLLLDRHGEVLGELTDDPAGRHGFWPLESVPRRVAQATVAVEDRRFWRHPGVDAPAVGRALIQNFRSGRRVSGASTVAMQVARMQRPGPRTYLRKAAEASTAVWMVARHGRREVLRHYLQRVPYGNQVHGIRHAARRYFDKPVADLSWAETAFLAAIPQAPARMNPHDPLGRARAVRRGLQILELIAEQGWLTRDEAARASAQIRTLRIPPRSTRPDEVLHAVLRFQKDAAVDAGRPVRTTLDLSLQRDVTWIARRGVERWRRKGAGNVAALVVELPGGHVRAAVGSADFFDADYAGSIDYLKVPRSSGSTLKPFFYGLALDRGELRPTWILDDLERGAGGIQNSDGRFLGPLLPRYALANSRNVPAATVLSQLGLDKGWALLDRLGLVGGARASAAHPAGPERYGLGLTIGGLAVTVEDLAEAYTVLAGDGLRRPLRWLEAPEPPPPTRHLGEDAARLVTSFLSDVQARLPSFPRTGSLEVPFPAAFKTGTSSRYRDAWTVAYTRRWLVVVWVGHPDHHPMQGVSGYRGAAPIARDILMRLHPEAVDGLDPEPFPAPRGYRQARTCPLTGRRAGPACGRVVAEWRRAAAPPLEPCRAHRLVAVEKTGGRLASSATPPAEVEVRSFVELPARYAAWQAAAGLPRPPSVVADGLRSVASPAGPSTTVRITSPVKGLRVFLDPEMPPSRNTLALRAVVDPPPEQILWRVNGEPFALANYPFVKRWPLRPGDHTIQAEVPFTDIRSPAVTVRVE
ncbi:MAG: transglycosylase domain-containing protein [Acidobacteriota bacterium]